MKKLLVILMAVIAVMLPSCKSEAGADEVAKKIENNETLTQDDYGVMLDYIKPEIEQIVKFIEMGGSESDVDALEKKFPHSRLFIQTIVRDEHSFNPENMKKAQAINELYIKAFEEAAKKQGLNLSDVNNELPEKLPGFSEEVNEHTPTD